MRQPDDHGASQCAAGEVTRLATARDLPSVRRVIDAAYAVYLDRMDRPPAPVLHDYRPEVEAGAVWVLGAPVLAVIVLIPDGDSLLVENVAVDPAAQGTRLGRRLMAFAEDQAIALGLDRVTLYANEVMTENLAFYAKLGYRETGRSTQDGYRRVFLAKALPDRSDR
jgi:ribosomal protein S18 acetylase RimI-like enzyme